MTLDRSDNASFSAQTLTLRLLASYLAVTAFPVIRHGFTGGASAVVAAFHVSVLAAVLALLATRPTSRPYASWVPLVLWPALYAEMPFVIAALGGTLHDAAVQSWEGLLFRGQPASTLASALPSSALSELLHLGYLAYYPIIYLPPLFLFVRRRDQAFADTVLAVTAVWLVCLGAFAVYPVAGPRYLLGDPPHVPHGPVRTFAVWLLERASSRGTAFPSSHVAVSVAQTLTALRFQRTVGLVTAVATALLAVGAVYSGFHYAIDVAAGGALGALGVWAVGVRARYRAHIASARWSPRSHVEGA